MFLKWSRSLDTWPWFSIHFVFTRITNKWTSWVWFFKSCIVKAKTNRTLDLSNLKNFCFINSNLILIETCKKIWNIFLWCMYYVISLSVIFWRIHWNPYSRPLLPWFKIVQTCAVGLWKLLQIIVSIHGIPFRKLNSLKTYASISQFFNILIINWRMVKPKETKNMRKSETFCGNQRNCGATYVESYLTGKYF